MSIRTLTSNGETYIVTDKYLLTFINGRLFSKINRPLTIPNGTWYEVHVHSVLLTKASRLNKLDPLFAEYVKYTDSNTKTNSVDLTGKTDLTNRLITSINATLTVETPTYLQLIGLKLVTQN